MNERIQKFYKKMFIIIQWINIGRRISSIIDFQSTDRKNINHSLFHKMSTIRRTDVSRKAKRKQILHNNRCY